ncbi:hypothetical protein PHLGIDRAFT_54960, partial [Phlebiopsis gigantea 11061_1 CR5-6]
ELLRDVPTRWDSTYLMLERARSMRPIIDHFVVMPENSYFAKYRLTQREWTVLADLEDVLHAPHTFLHLMARETTPTLCSSIKCIECWMQSWEQ